MSMTSTKATVHIHSGDIAAKKASERIPGRHLAYSDLLMVGPIPALDDMDGFIAQRAEVLHEELSVEGYSIDGIRRKLSSELLAISDALRTADAVCLWFDHCLFDQMLLHFMLSAFLHSCDISIYLVPCPDRVLGFGELAADEMALCLCQSKKLENQDLKVSLSVIWPALTNTDMDKIIQLSHMSFKVFPDTPAAAQRLLEELPREFNGLNRLESAILETVLDGRSQFIDIFKAVSRKERYPFFGDAYVRKRIDVLASGPSPLLCVLPNGSITATLQGARTLWGWGNWRKLHPCRRYVANLCLSTTTITL